MRGMILSLVMTPLTVAVSGCQSPTPVTLEFSIAEPAELPATATQAERESRSYHLGRQERERKVLISSCVERRKAEACVRAGDAQARGDHGLKIDPDNARQFYALACTLGDNTGCQKRDQL